MVQPGLAPIADEALRVKYAAYCAEQAAALPALLPRDGLRSLYRSARAGVSGEVVDPLALLVERCRELLPLPPFEVWAADYQRDRRPYLEPLEEATAGGMRTSAMTLDLRAVDHAGSSWVASLAVFREPPDWRGFISFQLSDEAVAGGRPLQRTADIFLESRAEDVRSRFRAFSDDTLQAFLRSTLP
jgi:hypothetical protein